MTFPSLGLTEPLLRNLTALGHETPTPVQTQAIPAALAGRDLTVQAETGSGKTAAFALPLLQRLSEEGLAVASNSVRALVLVPTRELAEQVYQSFCHYGEHLPLRYAAVYGGASINPQMMKLRPGVDVLIATPGRLLDLISQNALSLAKLSILVLDEADKLLDMGFADEVGKLLALLPPQRQSLFFSATFPPAVQSLATKLLNNPSRIEVAATGPTEPTIQQRAIQVDANRRTQLLRHLLQENGWKRILVFVATKYAAELITHKLGKAGIKAAAFYGELSQHTRSLVLADFKASRLQVLVATDVAARGLDIEQLPAVVNYDLPRSAVDYTHRIGRTGRAGETGVAISFVMADSEAHFRLIEKRQGCLVPREQIAGFEPKETAVPVAVASADSNDPDHPSNGGIKGKRKSKKDKLRETAALALQSTKQD